MLANPVSPKPTAADEPGSFRDRNGKVFYQDDAVHRLLSERSYQDWQQLSKTGFFERASTAGKLVQTELVEVLSADAAGQAHVGDGSYAAVLRHERIPFISYPYEWAFGMLREAALLHLELLEQSLLEGMILKDSSAYNIQWKGAKPLLIDIPSFERLAPGEPWVGYRQFCEMFLFPLMLQAYRNVPFQPWLRGNIDGIDVESCASLFSVRDWFRPGVLMHVVLQRKLQAQFGATNKSVKGSLRSAGFHKELILANVRKLRSIVQKLTLKEGRSEWSHYATELPSYEKEEQQRKQQLVAKMLGTRRWKLAWDFGCNTGTFSRLASQESDYVVAMDADSLAVERLYSKLKDEKNQRILPLIINVANTSPNQGWRGLERKSLVDRGTPSVILCLALIHHVVISANVPLKEFVEWLGQLGAHLIIEFVTKDDPMVKKLLLNKEDIYTDYELPYFESVLASRFTVQEKSETRPGTRYLYFCAPR